MPSRPGGSDDDLGGGSLVSPGRPSAFVARYAGSLELVWAKTFAATGALLPADLAATASGLTFAGDLTGSASVASAPSTSNSPVANVLVAALAP